MPRENSAKIFISSTSQESLQPLRNKLKNILNTSGHLALLYEENFGLWTDNTLMDCLRKVSESDIYLLFISNKSGSFTQMDRNITATYAEYLRASADNKIIIPFVEKHILRTYKEHIELPLKRKIEQFVTKYDRDPDYTYEIVLSMIEEEKESQSVLYNKLTSDVDSFQWGFIHDVYSKQWTYNAALAETEEASQFVIESLSQILKTLSPYYNLLNEIQTSIAVANNLVEYRDSVNQFLQFIRNGKLNIKSTLYTLGLYLKGGHIKHNSSPLDNRILATLSDCSGICLYSKVGENLDLVDYSGQITPTTSYSIDDCTSFVSQTFKKDNEDLENIFYSQEKQLIYLTKKMGKLILSAHFVISDSWSETRVKSYENQILNAIMNQREQYDFVVDLIGGMLNE